MIIKVNNNACYTRLIEEVESNEYQFFHNKEPQFNI